MNAALSSYRVLIIEDDEIICQVLQHMLTAAGHEVMVERDGDAGESRAKSDSPDLVITDMNLPRKLGWDLIRDLKTDPATAAIPIIALSGHRTADDRDAAYEAGCSLYLEKPVDGRKLHDGIRRLMA